MLLHGRDTLALGEVCRRLKTACSRVVPLIHDLATSVGVLALIREVGHAPLDLVVNNAGIAIVKPFAEITQVEWEQTLGSMSPRLSCSHNTLPRG